MGYPELQLHLLEQIKEHPLRFKVEALLVLDTAARKVKFLDIETREEYAVRVYEEINSSQHRKLLSDLERLVEPHMKDTQVNKTPAKAGS